MISYLFRWHHWPPSVFYNMEPGEQRVTMALVRNEIEQRNDEAKQMGAR